MNPDFNFTYRDYLTLIRGNSLNRSKEYILKKEQKAMLRNNHIKPTRKFNQQNKKLIKYISLQH